MTDRELRSECAIAATLDIVGDRWSLLVVRDLFFRDELRYGDLAASAESMPTNTLADRLRRLTDAGIVDREQYSSKPPRFSYRLTDRGRAMAPILDAMATWGTTHIAGTRRLTRDP
ncbi:winged helix-turn-helix transcriptional regulator [Nocardiopsis suaedae]|uniref:Helix-turn-helix domain-containing protein n=1 Tax=Nocardiopsis suaedae TaxID=3018444 RepID=A0ABT4TJG7_9ACTN|nr:helix-turn-helix domain-containing protein [Nocardiopsis suaedae]MDA2804849.1 helix-turn-helix domain-containing protein [Nocardiopsis suaedae]